MTLQVAARARRTWQSVSSPRLAAVVGRAAVLSLVLYLVMRPENYGLTPNGLDPAFYTGYATNFDDMLSSVGQSHYFVSRWSQYMPAYLFTRVFGAVAGRLLWRLVLSTAILTTAWRLGRRWQWTIAHELLVGTVLVTMPMFVRAFFTDYTEYAVVAYGLLLVMLCLRERQTPWSIAALGVLAGLLVVANPIAVTVLAGPLAVACWLGAATRRGRIVIAAGVCGAATATLLLGWWWFRWRYGLPNVYRPTVDFLRNPPGQDPLRSPRLEWLGKFTWLYGPPIVMVAYLGTARLKQVRLQRIELVAIGLCALQYVYQWVDQFVRKGDGLEISYYWSFMYPAFGVVLLLGLARLTAGVRARTLVGITVSWCAFLIVGVPDALRLPSGVWFVLVALAVVGAAIVVAPRSAAWSAVALLGLLGWIHLGAPHYDPSAYHPFDMSPRYDDLYRQAGNESEQRFGETLWFERQMDTVAHDARAFFVPLSGAASCVVAVYGPHVTDHLLDPAADAGMMLQTAELRAGDGPVLIVLYGPPSQVAAKVGQFAEAGSDAPVLDRTHDGDLGFRLVVFENP